MDQSIEDPFEDQHSGVNSHYKIELVEDYAKYFIDSGVEYVRLAQIKHHNRTAGNSDYLEALLFIPTVRKQCLTSENKVLCVSL